MRCRGWDSVCVADFRGTAGRLGAESRMVFAVHMFSALVFFAFGVGVPMVAHVGRPRRPKESGTNRGPTIVLREGFCFGRVERRAEVVPLVTLGFKRCHLTS